MLPRQRQWPYLVTIALLVLALILLTLLDKWGISLWTDKVDHVQFGTWSEAVSGIATSVAVIVTLLSLNLQRAADRATARAKDIEQETAVHIWLIHKKLDQGPNKPALALWDAVIRNATPAPIYKWKATILRGPITLCSSDYWPLRPGENNLFNVRDLDGVDPANTPEASITFIGRSGQTWTRLVTGQIQAVDASALELKKVAGG